MGMICTNVSRQNSCICFGEKGKKKHLKKKANIKMKKIKKRKKKKKEKKKNEE